MKKTLFRIFVFVCIQVLLFSSAFAEWKKETEWIRSEDGKWGWEDTWVYYDDDGNKVNSFRGMKSVEVPAEVDSLSRYVLKGFGRDFVLKVKKGSYAESFAKRYGIQYDNGEKSVVGYEIDNLEEKAKWVISNYVEDNYKGSALSARETAEVLHDWLTTNATYDHYSLEEGHNRPNQAESCVLLTGTGVCNSYAEAYSYLLNKVNIPNRYLSGHAGGFSSNESEDKYQDNHAWDLVLIDGQWYHTDTTWDDPGGESSETVEEVTTGFEGKSYHLVTDAEIVDLDPGRRWDKSISADNNVVGFVAGNDGLYYYGEKSDTSRVSTGWTEVESELIYNPLITAYQYQQGGKYYFSPDKDGLMATGWTQIGDARYYFSNTGVMRTGWLDQDGVRYHLAESGAMDTGWRNMTETYQQWNGETGEWEIKQSIFRYYFGDDGIMRTGWVTVNGKRYHLANNGHLDRSMWLSEGGNVYYLDQEGCALTGLQELPGWWSSDTNYQYYFNEQGIMQTGLQTVDGNKRFFNTYGEMISSRWYSVDDSTYYIDADGIVLSGFQTIDGRLYYFDEDGKTGSGWTEVDGKTYYLRSLGSVAKGLEYIDESCYLFDETTGVMQTGWQTIDDDTYYFDNDGKAVTGKQHLTRDGEEKDFLFYDDCTLHTVHTESLIPGKAATCTETGLTEGSRCTVCEEILVAQTEIPAKGHTAEAIPGKAATCTETGLTEGSRCTVCEEILVAQTEIPAKGHTAEAIPGKAATCTETGLTEGSKCTACDEILIAQTEIPAKGHTIEVNPAVEATCEHAGHTEGKACTVCGEILEASKEIPILDHTPVIDPEVTATYTSVGLTKGSHCAACGKILQAQETIPMLVVIPGDVNEDGIVDGRDVIVLMKYLADEIDPKTGKTYEINRKNADVDASRKVDEKDLLRLVKYLAGEKVTLEKGKIE